jgi:hypothetical protein
VKTIGNVKTANITYIAFWTQKGGRSKKGYKS